MSNTKERYEARLVPGFTNIYGVFDHHKLGFHTKPDGRPVRFAIERQLHIETDRLNKEHAAAAKAAADAEFEAGEKASKDAEVKARKAAQKAKARARYKEDKVNAAKAAQETPKPAGKRPKFTSGPVGRRKAA